MKTTMCSELCFVVPLLLLMSHQMNKVTDWFMWLIISETLMITMSKES